MNTHIHTILRAPCITYRDTLGHIITAQSIKELANINLQQINIDVLVLIVGQSWTNG